jgi:hypothetical protein
MCSPCPSIPTHRPVRGGQAVRSGLAVLCGVLACLAGAARAQAQEARSSNVQLRLYVNAFTAGKIDKTPVDPNGTFDGHVPGNDGAALELILFRHVGLSIAQDFESRHSTDGAGNDLKEKWTNTYTSLTVYVREAGRNRWNLFLGASSGTVDRYAALVNGVASPSTDPARNLPLTRAFGGLELVFQRIGFRAQVVQSEAADTITGQKVHLNQTLQVLSVFIPFN